MYIDSHAHLYGPEFSHDLGEVIARARQSGVEAIVVPGSQQVKAQAESEGLDRIFVDAGFEWRESGCSMCLAMKIDKLEPGDRCAATSNRNFEGRQGKGGRTHLAGRGDRGLRAGAQDPARRSHHDTAARHRLRAGEAPHGRLAAARTGDRRRTATGRRLAIPGALHARAGSSPDAVAALDRALELTNAQPSNQDQLNALRSIHYQLGLALRRAGNAEEAAQHFAVAEQASEKATDAARGDLAKYLADTPDPAALNAAPPPESVFPLSAVPAAVQGRSPQFPHTTASSSQRLIGIDHRVTAVRVPDVNPDLVRIRV